MLYEARLALRSPAIVTSKRTERGYVKPLSFIPGSTLRGALLSALYRAGSVGKQELAREAREPSLLASAALPVAEGRRTVPATPFMAVCKLCGRVVDLTREAADTLQELREPRFALYCPSDGSPLEPLHGYFVYAAGGGLATYKPRTFRSTSVAISKERGSAVKGLLFDYEAIAEGSEFWAYVYAPDSLKLPERLEVYVGRGQSRGFGWAELALRPARAQPLPQRGVFVAISPLAPLSSVSWRGCELRIGKVYGRSLALQLGWDLAASRPRPIARLARPGSVVAGELRCGDHPSLRAGLPVEIAGFTATGLNSIVSVEEFYGLMGVV